MYQLRIYTIADPEAAEQYYSVHWQRHIASLKKFGITTERIFKELTAEGHTRVIGLVRYEEGTDVEAANAAYMQSAEFCADMEGFDMRKMVKVEAINLIGTEVV